MPIKFIRQLAISSSQTLTAGEVRGTLCVSGGLNESLFFSSSDASIALCSLPHTNK